MTNNKIIIVSDHSTILHVHKIIAFLTMTTSKFEIIYKQNVHSIIINSTILQWCVVTKDLQYYFAMEIACSVNHVRTLYI